MFHKNYITEEHEKKIAGERFSLLDDPHIPEGIGTKSVDDEGIETQRKYLIEKGIFKNTFSNLKIIKILACFILKIIYFI